VSTDCAIEAFEDPMHYLHQEGKLPVNLTPGDNRLKRPEDRERLRQVFEAGLDQPVGFVLPLARTTVSEGKMWRSGLWMLRGKHLVLMPGDPPVRLRVPRESLAWVDPRHAVQVHERDPLEDRLPLSPIGGRGRRVERRDPAKTGESADWVVRTALVVQPREGGSTCSSRRSRDAPRDRHIPKGWPSQRNRRRQPCGARSGGPATRRDLQWTARPAAPDRNTGRIRGRRALPGMAAAVLPAPDDRGPYAGRI